ncbi:hypothetical protein LCGC14_2940870 [marine sediment metagenome]|uniref:Uncharacterized protein n=1 Tax=marine sediment metagenome TaxID=412755 RepID=A0A0F8Y516_9ZZZZ
MDVFDLHQHVVDDYAAYTKSFIRISDERISAKVLQDISEGLLWPEPLLQLNPSFAPGKRIDELVAEGVLHEDCGRIFRIKKNDNDVGRELRLYIHQEQAIRIAAANEPSSITLVRVLMAFASPFMTVLAYSKSNFTYISLFKSLILKTLIAYNKTAMYSIRTF